MKDTESEQPLDDAAAQPGDHSPCSACTHVRPVDACRYCGGARKFTGPRLAPIDLVSGFRFYWRGVFSVIHEKDFLGRILGAILLASALLIGLIWAAIAWLHPLIEAALAALPSFFSGVVPALVTTLACCFLFPFLLTVVLFPVLDPIARIGERHRLGYRKAEEHPRGPIADFWDSMDTSARILGLQIIALLVSIPLCASAVAAPLAFLVAAFFAGFTWLDYPASRHQMRFADKMRLARRHWALLTGYGTAFLVGCAIPFFNPCLATPAAAAGSAELWLRMDKTELARARN